MALPTMAAPSRPAPMPQPRPLASADVVVEAMLPVTARVASARAAILVLIDMRNSIRLRAGPLWPACPVGRSVFESGSKRRPEISDGDDFLAITDGYRGAVSPSDRTKGFADRICRGRRAIRRTRARRDRANVRLSPPRLASRRRRRRLDEGPAPATRTAPAGAGQDGDKLFPSRCCWSENRRFFRCAHAACIAPA